MKLVVMGTPDFSVPTLRHLHEAGHEIGYVVTQPDRRGNRNKISSPPMKIIAEELGIPVLQPENLDKDEITKKRIFQYKPDAIVVVAFGQILKEDILNLPKFGCFNVHGSLLPKLRGASPIQQAILDGIEKTGITIIKMDSGLDTGDMISTEEVAIGDKTLGELHDEMAELGGNLMTRTLKDIQDGTAIYTPQNNDEATYSGKIKKSQGKIDFENESNVIIERKIRAFDPWPGAYCNLDNKILKIWKAEVKEGSSQESPGSIIKVNNDSFDIICRQGILRVTEVQLQGKRRMHVADFIRGKKLSVGEKLN